jgi:hypothetical protein
VYERALEKPEVWKQTPEQLRWRLERWKAVALELQARERGG